MHASRRPSEFWWSIIVVYRLKDVYPILFNNNNALKIDNHVSMAQGHATGWTTLAFHSFLLNF